MKAKLSFTVCCLLIAVAAPGVDKKAKPPVQKTAAVAAAPANLYLPPRITQADCPCLPDNGRLDVFGKGFGSSQENRVVRVNGAALPAALTWQKTHIRCSHDYSFPGGATVHIDIFDTAKSARVSNVFDYFVPFCIYGHDPAGAFKSKGQVFLLTKQEVGAAAAGRKVMIGDKEAPADWLVHRIRLVVPIMNPGDYSLRLEKNGQVISNIYPVTVQ
jgi:hypothetical protein